jgi:hypothetical protein
MRNSAWYYKLWLKKLSKLPVKEDAGSAWAGMKDMLDAQMPVSNTGNNSGGSHGNGSNGGNTVATKPFTAKLISLLGYALPVAAAIGVTTYLVSPVVIKPENVVALKKPQAHLLIDTVNSKDLPVFADSLINKDTDSARVLSVNSLSGDLKGVKPEANELNKQSFEVKQDAGSKTENIQVENYAIKKQPGNSENIVSPNIGLAKGATTSAIESVQQGKEGNRTSARETITDDEEKAIKKEKATNKEKAGNKEKITNRENVAGGDKVSGGKAILSPAVNVGNPAAKVVSSKKTKVSRNPGIKEVMTTPDYNFGLESGWNTGKNNGLYVGVFGAYSIKTNLLLNVGIRLNTSTALSGSYITKPSGYLRDTVSTYKISDNRKLMVLNVPLTLEYRLSNKISINAGPVISFPLSQSKINIQSERYKAQLPSTKYLDSARHSAVDSTLNYTKVNKVNLGITGGISVRFHQFYIEGKYLRNLTPYKVSNKLGGYQQYNGSFQLGLRYQFRR